MDRLLKGISYIEAHLSETLALDAIAEAAHLSPHHFARSFRATAGDTVMGYVRKRRLSIAAEHLAYAGTPIMEIALNAGFDSQEAFTRAFKRQFGVTPGTFRKQQKSAWVHHREAITAATLPQFKEIANMVPEIKTHPGLKVVGYAADLDADTRGGIPALWERLIPAMDTIANALDGTTFGICKGTSESGAFRYLAGMEVSSIDDVPDGMEAWEIPAQKYAVFPHRLTSANIHEDIQPTVLYIWGTWAESGEHKLAKAPDLERYSPDFRGEPGQIIEFWIPIE